MAQRGIWLALAVLSLVLSTSTIFEANAAAAARKEDAPPVELDSEEMAQARGFYVTNKEVNFEGELATSAFGMVFFGERNRALVRMENRGKSNYTVAALSGVLLDAQNTSRVVRNLTAQQFRTRVPPRGNVTLGFDFTVDIEPPAEAMLVVLVDYMRGNGPAPAKDELPFRGVALTSPIQIVFNDSWFDMQSLFLYALGIACVVGVGFLFKNTWLAGSAAGSGKRSGARRAKPVAAPTAAAASAPDAVQNEWIPEHIRKLENLDGQNGGSRRRRKGGK